MKPEDIKVRVVFTEGYAQRYTAACLEVLERRKKREALEKGMDFSMGAFSVPRVEDTMEFTGTGNYYQSAGKTVVSSTVERG